MTLFHHSEWLLFSKEECSLLNCFNPAWTVCLRSLNSISIRGHSQTFIQRWTTLKADFWNKLMWLPVQQKLSHLATCLRGLMRRPLKHCDALQTLYYTNNIVTENSTLAAKPVCHNKYLTAHVWLQHQKCIFYGMPLKKSIIQDSWQSELKDRKRNVWWNSENIQFNRQWKLDEMK